MKKNAIQFKEITIMNNFFVKIYFNISNQLKLLLSKIPILSIYFYRIFTKKRSLVISRNTNLVIEGFPRSANTFSVVAFESVQTKKIIIAHHLHLPFQINYACKHNIPALVLIREPTEAISSAIIFNNFLSIAEYLKSYIYFYTSISNCNDKFIVGLFDEVIHAYDKIIFKLNNKFNTQFNLFYNSPTTVKRCFEKIEENNESNINENTIPHPSLFRKIKKEEIKNKLSKPEYKHLLKEAEKIYNHYAQMSKTQNILYL